MHGVTYGPFTPEAEGLPFPTAQKARADFELTRSAGINTIRTYHVPPDWLFRPADEAGLAILVDVPWPKHLCFLNSRSAQADARRAVREAAVRGREHLSVLAYSICNEVTANIVRWHGATRVERFLSELVTYANYLSTEYLDLSTFDFVTFNVYRHDAEVFCRYLFRLHHLVGDRPLLLGELGMDTLRHGELAQAEILSGHVRESLLSGLAGAFVFSWTDDWHTGGHAIRDWAFGITTAERPPGAWFSSSCIARCSR